MDAHERCSVSRLLAGTCAFGDLLKERPLTNHMMFKWFYGIKSKRSILLGSRLFSRVSKSPKNSNTSGTRIKFEISPTVKLFENANINPMTFRVITAVTIFQLPMWLFLAYHAMTELKPSQKEKEKEADADGGVLGVSQKEMLKCNAEEDGVPFAFPKETLEVVHEEDKRGEAIEIKVATKEPGEVEDKRGETIGSRVATKEPGEVEDKRGETIGSRVATKEPGEAKDWFSSSKWRISLSLLSLGAGVLFSLMVYIYPRRVVRSITYLRPSQTLQLVTYTPQGATRTLDVPLADVTCRTHSTEQARGQNIALKVNGHPLFFLLNMTNAHVDPLLRTLVLNRYTSVKQS